jgi:hypothetical protein
MKAERINPVLRALRLVREPIRILYSSHQLSDRRPQRFSDCLNRKKARVLHPSFYPTQKCPINGGFGGKRFLRQFPLQPELSNLLTKSLGNIVAHLRQFCPFTAVNGCRLYTTRHLDNKSARHHHHSHAETRKLCCESKIGKIHFLNFHASH